MEQLIKLNRVGKKIDTHHYLAMKEYRLIGSEGG